MQRTITQGIIRFRAWCIAAAILTVIVPALAQKPKSPWIRAQGPSGATEVSARSEIAAPQGAGFATLKIFYRTGGNPSVIVYFIVESPKHLPAFPFNKYDGPVDKTEKEFIRFEIEPVKQGATSSVKVMPNGYYAVDPPDAFVFDTIDKRVVSFLSGLRDGQRLAVMVNGPQSPIRVVFDTTGLKKLLEQMGLKVGVTEPGK